MSAVIPKNLSLYLRTITGYHKNLIRFYPDRTGTINSGDVLRWTFPREILNIESLTHFFDFSTTYYGSKTGPIYQGFYFPRNSSSIIDTTTLFINGQVFENINGYNHLFNLLWDNTCGTNYYQSGIRALEGADPSMRYTIANDETITATIQGSNVSSATDPSDSARTFQIRNFIGFLGTCKPTVLDLRNVEVIYEIRYAPATIMWKGADISATTTPTAAYTITNFYMTIEKITFDDDYYGMALSALKNSGNYTIVYKTYNTARGASVTKTSNPSLQFSTTAKYLSSLYLTFIDANYTTINYIQNTSNNVSWAKQIADPATYPNAFNQSVYFKKTAVSLTDSQIEINGSPVYPYPQTLQQIKNNNLTSLGLDYSKSSADHNGLFSLESWSKYSFLQAINFEHPSAFEKEDIISGYPNQNNVQLNLKWNTNWNASAANNVYMLAFMEKYSQVLFNGGSVSISF